MEKLKTAFERREDLDKAMRSVAEFAEDAIHARLFELSLQSESNLFHIDDPRFADLLKTVCPDLTSEQELLRECSDLEDRVFDLILDTRSASFMIGVLVGARFADPSGRCFADLTRGWIRAMLAQPRYRHLTISNGNGKAKKGARPL